MNDLLTIQNKIYVIRGQRVMLDRDLASLYGVETSQLKRAVKRNFKRFEGEDFMMEVSQEEILRCQIGTSSWGGNRYNVYAFTELGVAMLSSVLHSEIAIEINIIFLKLVPHYLFREYIWLLNTIIPAVRHLFQQCASLCI